MPADWESFQVHYRYRQSVYHIHVKNASGGPATVTRVICDGAEQADETIPLTDDQREHQVQVEMGSLIPSADEQAIRGS
jgi:cellobiose phosphorylase